MQRTPCQVASPRLHGDFQTHLMKLLHCVKGIVLQSVCYGDKASRPAINGNKHCSLAVVFQSLGLGQHRLQGDGPLSHKLAVAEKDFFPLPLGLDPVSGYGLEPVSVRNLIASFLGASNNGFTQRMLRVLFRDRRKFQDFSFGQTADGDYIRHRRLSAREGSGFVKHNRIQLCRGLNGVRAFE